MLRLMMMMMTTTAIKLCSNSRQHKLVMAQYIASYCTEDVSLRIPYCDNSVSNESIFRTTNNPLW